MAVLTTGRRCPNAAIEGSTYCGLPQHQALSRFDTSQMAVLASLAEAEVEILADPDADQGMVDEIVAKAEAEFVEDAASEDEGPADEPAGPVAEEDSDAGEEEELAEDAESEVDPEPVAEEAE